MLVWRPIESAPWETEVLLTGDSGYIAPHDRFVINGYREPDWHGGAWNDATGSPLSDHGWEPTHWAPAPMLPTIGVPTADPVTQETSSPVFGMRWIDEFQRPLLRSCRREDWDITKEPYKLRHLGLRNGSSVTVRKVVVSSEPNGRTAATFGRRLDGPFTPQLSLGDMLVGQVELFWVREVPCSGCVEGPASPIKWMAEGYNNE